HQISRLERSQVSEVAGHLCELRKPHFRHCRRRLRAEADLRQAPLQRHLTAFEPHLVVAALASALPLDAPSAGLAPPGGGAAAHTQTRLLATRGGGDRIELHDLAALHGTTLRLNSAVAQTSSTRSRCPDARIIPRISGVSATIRESRMRRRPSPRTVARWLLSCPLTLRTSVTLRFLP